MFGLSQIRFWTGVVEDIKDPESQGRIRVRVHGIHTSKKIRDEEEGEGIPTEDLPWAVPIMPVTHACISGLGTPPPGLLPGTWVYGCSIDGELAQQLLVLGGIPTKASASGSGTGFEDPNGQYPTAAYKGKTDINAVGVNAGGGDASKVAAGMGITPAYENEFGTTICPNVDFDKLTACVIKQESGGKATAVSKVGARGLMQLMPGTAQDMAKACGLEYSAEKLFDPSYNKRLGQAYLRKLLKMYNCNVALALAAYNYGPGNVNKLIRANGDPRTGAISDAEWAAKIPVKETNGYVKNIVASYGGFDAIKKA